MPVDHCLPTEDRNPVEEGNGRLELRNPWVGAGYTPARRRSDNRRGCSRADPSLTNRSPAVGCRATFFRTAGLSTDRSALRPLYPSTSPSRRELAWERD